MENTDTQTAWQDIKRLQSKDENVSKYVFTKSDAVAEAVLYKYPTYEERTVICCSTQSGCPVGCRFCGAGDFFIRSLTSDEIIGQVDYLLSDRSIDINNAKRAQIMFMSMGEPLLNRQALTETIERLYAAYPAVALLISTSAPDIDYIWVRDLSVRVPTVGLQFSVHESTNAARNELVPFKAKLDLAGIAREGVAWYEATGRQPFFNYCAHAGNTSSDDADRILALYDPKVWQATISVVCERDESIAAANERQRSLAADFMLQLADRGFSTRCFDPAGQDDIGGGCGQLWYVQDFAAKNPDLTKRTAGTGRQKVHAPQLITLGKR